jgi:Fe2+ or Zn2+ uptake regulation protein
MSCEQALQAKRLLPHAPADHGGGCDLNRPMAREEIFELMRGKYLYANISIVYRMLELLKELGLAAEIGIGDGIVCYHAKKTPDTNVDFLLIMSYHYHLSAE